MEQVACASTRLLWRNRLLRSSCFGRRTQPKGRAQTHQGSTRAPRGRCFATGGYERTQRTLIGCIKESLESAVRDKFSDYLETVDITECANPSLGDYQCSSAMQIFSALRKAGETDFCNPREVAAVIVDGISDTTTFDSITIAGAGFINFKLSDHFILTRLRELGKTVKPTSSGESGSVLVDFSSPNIAKEMHVGHLRSTIIGDALCNVFEFCGLKTIRLNHVGDWGTQFGMLIQFMTDNKVSPDSAVSDLQECYKRAKERFDQDDDFKSQSKQAVIKLQSYDADALRTWKQICDASRAEFQTIYDRLNISIIERGESYYNDMIPAVLDELVAKNVVVEDAGALCIFDDDHAEAPVICRKSDGGFNYASTDLAAIRHRALEEKVDRIIYVTDQGQQKHFRAIFKTAHAAGWGHGGVVFEHVGFGVVLGEDGKRLRTRSGETVKLKSLLDEAEERCLQFLKEKGTDLSAEELSTASRILGVSSVKYADLHNNRLTAYTFSFDRMLDLKGNTAMYLQYSHARVATILRKAPTLDLPLDGLHFENAAERLLAVHLIKLDDVLAATMKELAPSKICDYLYTLCTMFNNFYAECKVIGGENEASRLFLCMRTAATMKIAFSLLGMEPLERL
ncbi:Arginine-tRNA ligase, class Ia [Ostreococcus tauri]|uniref:arginine--tRNA ligase n=1 Tax=Ostreococcus tauri TaxID=70448 RepID=A0A090N4M3_OSTTA|nr:Arginine-tRNA ligase, class Ia [Ostreococcus tauri]CEG00960.1 Arginine-tRNA ligase, class Ia [Ostreococcus tauri]|eukprot:XP_022840700.1 Arginine-tRNA ligase, class Ia [Ostreococcus tauri]